MIVCRTQQRALDRESASCVRPYDRDRVCESDHGRARDCGRAYERGRDRVHDHARGDRAHDRRHEHENVRVCVRPPSA